MKSSIKIGFMTLATLAMTVYIAHSIGTGKSGALMWFFLSFVVLIIVFQLCTGIALFFCMVRGLFSGKPKHTGFAVSKKTKS